jgi:hypothetical protein
MTTDERVAVFEQFFERRVNSETPSGPTMSLCKKIKPSEKTYGGFAPRQIFIP